MNQDRRRGAGLQNSLYLTEEPGAIMKRCVTLAVAIFLIQTGGLFAVDEFTRVREPNPEQKQVIATLTREIAAVQRDIERFYETLKERECGTFYGGENIYCEYYKIDQNGVSLVPLTSQVETYYGQRQRYVYNEQVSIKWNGPKIVGFDFSMRRGYIGKGQVLLKSLAGNSIITGEPAAGGQAQTTAAEAPLNLVVNELLSSGKGLYVNFRFPDQQMQDVRDRYEDIEVDGQKRNIQVIFIRDPDQKIRVMREYLRLLRLLERRLDWNVRAETARRASEVQRILQTDFD